MPERWQQELRKLKSLEPPPGLWDRAMQGPRRPWRRPVRAHKTWSAIAAALAVAVVVVGTFGLVRVFGPAPGRPGSIAKGQVTRFVDPNFGWTIRIPAGLRARHFQVQCLHGPISGIRVTSFAPNLRAPSTSALPMGWLRSFPADGVAVQIWYGCSLASLLPPRDSTFPLSPSSFRRARPYVGGNEPHPWYCDCYGDGIGFNAAVWIGPHVSRAERHAAWAVVRSLRFPTLRAGTMWHGYFVLGRPSRYPAGSVTTFPLASLPVRRRYLEGFYLIHGPRGFYIITMVFLTQPPPSYKVFMCTVAFDQKKSQFFCPGTDLRWNRVGQTIRARAGRGQYWDLQLYKPDVAQDGHILVPLFSR